MAATEGLVSCILVGPIGGKDELADQAIRSYGETVRSLLARCLDDADIESALVAFTSALANQLERSGFRAGCPVGVTAMEAAPANSALAGATASAFDSWIRTLEARLDEEDVPGAHDLALTAVAAVEGAVMLARATSSTEPLHVITAALIRLYRMAASETDRP
jgi:TetR/AcrR family transcriptional regulator, lmrAB and yxaGH operons repressor